jgi:hypothetical protein
MAVRKNLVKHWRVDYSGVSKISGRTGLGKESDSGVLQMPKILPVRHATFACLAIERGIRSLSVYQAILPRRATGRLHVNRQVGMNGPKSCRLVRVGFTASSCEVPARC